MSLKGVGVPDGQPTNPGAAAFGVAGVAASDTTDSAPSPALLVARTVHVYSVPLVKPVTVHNVDVVTQVAPPGEAATV